MSAVASVLKWLQDAPVTAVSTRPPAEVTAQPATQLAVTPVTPVTLQNQEGVIPLPVTPVTPVKIAGVTAQPATQLAVTPVTPVTPQNQEGDSAKGEERLRLWANGLGLESDAVVAFFCDDLIDFARMDANTIVNVLHTAQAAHPAELPRITPPPREKGQPPRKPHPTDAIRNLPGVLWEDLRFVTTLTEGRRDQAELIQGYRRRWLETAATDHNPNTARRAANTWLLEVTA